MPWTPPTKPPAGIATPDQLVAEAIEHNGAAYRTQKHAWVPQQDDQMPYWQGFTKTVHQYGQPMDVHVDVEGVAPPPDKPVGQRRPRVTGMKDVGPQGPAPAHRLNVPNTATHKETTGEDPAPLFTHGQITGRS
jgi:hypothetical protein